MINEFDLVANIISTMFFQKFLRSHRFEINAYTFGRTI